MSVNQQLGRMSQLWAVVSNPTIKSLDTSCTQSNDTVQMPFTKDTLVPCMSFLSWHCSPTYRHPCCTDQQFRLPIKLKGIHP